MTALSPPDAASDEASHPAKSQLRCSRIEVATMALMVIAGAVALAVGVWTREYDYDEITRAHSAWLTAQGLRPYSDYFECHPPYFALLIPIVRAFPDPTSLLKALRIFGVAGNLLFLGGLGTLAASSAGNRRWAWLGLGVVALHPAVLEYLIEFRIDGWGYALAIWTLVLFRRLSRGPRRVFALGLGTGVAAFLFSPKLALLPPMIVLFEMVGGWRSPRAMVRTGLAYAAGMGLAGGLVALSLGMWRIRFEDVFQLLVGYHSIANATSSFQHGLITSIVGHRVLFVITVLGLSAWTAHRMIHRSWPDAIEAGLAVWLALQALVVAYPYKQYYAPWFLFASGYLAFLGLGPAGRTGWHRAAFFAVVGSLTIYAALTQARVWSTIGEAYRQEAVIEWMDRLTGPEERVVAAPPYHPIDRHDTFFVWFNTIDPGGFDSESILGRLPSFRDKVTPARFREELAAHPPVLVTLSDRGIPAYYTTGQYAALREFLARNGYRTVRRGTGEFAVRPDRLDAAR